MKQNDADRFETCVERETAAPKLPVSDQDQDQDLDWYDLLLLHTFPASDPLPLWD